MVAHWRKQEGRNRTRLAINAVGAGTTVVALAVILAAKFIEGAWITVLAIPLIIGFLLIVRRYYDGLDAALQTSGPFQVEETQPPTVLVAVEGRNRMSDSALQFAMTLSPDVIAVHLLRLKGPESSDDGQVLKREWERDVVEPLRKRGIKPPRLLLLPAPFRELHEPLLKLITRRDEDTPGRSVAVLIPELIKRRWWEQLLHNQRADRLRRMLIEHGTPRLKVIIAPWAR